MDHFFNPQISQKHMSKKRLTHEQVKLLERSFTSSKKLEPERKLQLAKELGVPARQVAIWYQNKRARWKTQSLEFDYGALQVKLERAMAEKRVVEKEVEKLRGELKKAQEMVFAMNKTATNSCVTCNNHNNNNSSCDEGGSSSLQDGDVHWGRGGEDGVLPLEELYACFVGANNWS